MKFRILLSALLVAFLLISGCSGYVVPYVSMDLKPVYSTADIRVNYTYVCEDNPQRCVYALYKSTAADTAIYEEDSILPNTGVLEFSGLAEGLYKLDFSVYSEKDGEYYMLKFLDKSYEFEVDFP